MFGLAKLWNGSAARHTTGPRTFYGQFSPPQDKLLYEAYFRQRPVPGVFIECGAFDGVAESSCLFFEQSLGWTGINVEACPVVFEKLAVNRPSSRNLCVALSDHEGEEIFYHAVHPTAGRWFGNGSLGHTQAHKQDLLAMGCHLEEYRVKVVTYRTLLETTKITRLDLFVLDVEGFELTVIEGMRGAPLMPRVFCVEYGMIDVKHLDRTLAAMGFRKDCILHNNLVYLHDTF